MKRFFAVSIISLFAVVSFAFAQERRFTIDDLLKVRRVGDPQVSPKGDLVAFTITDVDKAANKSTTQIYLVPVGGGEVRQLTHFTTADRHQINLSRALVSGFVHIGDREGHEIALWRDLGIANATHFQKIVDRESSLLCKRKRDN